jgi:hypothetical protein
VAQTPRVPASASAAPFLPVIDVTTYYAEKHSSHEHSPRITENLCCEQPAWKRRNLYARRGRQELRRHWIVNAAGVEGAEREAEPESCCLRSSARSAAAFDTELRLGGGPGRYRYRSIRYARLSRGELITTSPCCEAACVTHARCRRWQCRC